MPASVMASRRAGRVLRTDYARGVPTGWRRRAAAPLGRLEPEPESKTPA